MIDIEEAFERATKIAEKVPKELQEAAFHRALDMLLGEQAPAERRTLKNERRGSKKRERATRSGRSTESSDVSALLDAIDRTKYKDIGSTTRVADNALKILKLVHDDHNVDGLTAKQIAEILTKKFRLPIKENSISKAMSRETRTVDERSGPNGVKVFHIMAPGDEYLEKLRSGKQKANGK